MPSLSLSLSSAPQSTPQQCKTLTPLPTSSLLSRTTMLRKSLAHCAPQTSSAILPSAVTDERTAIYIKLKYQAWDVRNRERAYRRCFGYQARWRGLLREVRQLRDRGWEVGTLTYNAVLRRYAGAGKVHYVDLTYRDMLTHNVPPNTTTHRLMLNALSRGRRGNPATLLRVRSIWKDMHTADVRPTLSSTHAAVRALCLLGAADVAHRIVVALQRTEASMADPYQIERFYAPLINASWRRWSRCLRYLQKILRAREAATAVLPPLQTETLCFVLKGAAWGGQYGAALAVFESMVAPTARSWGRLLQACVRQARRCRGHATCSEALQEGRRVWMRVVVVPGRVDDFGVRQYFALLGAEVRWGGGDVVKAVDEASAYLHTYLQDHAHTTSLHLWGAYMLLLAQCGEEARLQAVYTHYLAEVGRPWKPTEAVARRIRRAVVRARKRKTGANV